MAMLRHEAEKNLSPGDAQSKIAALFFVVYGAVYWFFIASYVIVTLANRQLFSVSPTTRAAFVCQHPFVNLTFICSFACGSRSCCPWTF
jgi:hypothetical protein